MSLHNTARRWGWPAKTLHWVIALLMIGLAVVGTFMANFTDVFFSDMHEATTVRVELTQTHKSFGFVVFVLACVRVIWRWLSPVTPTMPDNVKPWERVAAHLTHYGLYVLMFLLPLTGWLMASSSPLNDTGGYMPQIKNEVFGLFEMPDFYPTGDREISAFFNTIHLYAGYALAALLVLHVGAALKHHFALKDSVLRRMLPFGRE